MATLKVSLLPAKDGKKDEIVYKITYAGKIRIIKMDIMKNIRYNSVNGIIKEDKYIFQFIMEKLDNEFPDYGIDEISNLYKKYLSTITIKQLMVNYIETLRSNNRNRTAETYSSALRSFMRFSKGMDIPLHRLNKEVMANYQYWLKCQKLTPNSISFYIRNLRAAYNKAVAQGIIPDSHPFSHVYTGIDKTNKRYLTIAELRKIKNLELSPFSGADFARDMFMLSFYLRGMSFVDMAYLKLENLKDKTLIYYRHKTGQKLFIRWTSEMQQIIDKYPRNGSDYLLPILGVKGQQALATQEEQTNRNKYLTASHRINYNLRKVGTLAGIHSRLTMYCARHSWAMAARTKGVPLSIISEGMGHTSERTTRIYLDSFNNQKVDKANSIILNLLT